MTARARGARRAIGALVVAAAAVHLASHAARGDVRESLRALARPAHPGEVALAVVALAGVLAWGVFTWRCVLARLGGDARPASFGALLHVWALSSPVRWLPGGVWQVAAVGALARSAGQAPVRLASAFLVHTVLSLAAAGLVAAATLPHASGAWMAGALLAGAALVHPALLRRAVRAAARLAGAPEVAWRGSWRDGAWLLALHVASWLAYGAAFALLVRGAVGGAPPVAELTGATALAFLAGYAVLVAPGGLGAREIALSLLLAPTLGPAAPAVAVLARAWSLVGELTLGVAVLAAAVVGGRRTAIRGAVDAR